MNDSVNVNGWRQAYSSLLQQIESGTLQPGEQLPTLKNLSQEMGITIHAARRTMAKLKDIGLVDSWQGCGHRVSELRVTYSFERDTVTTDTTRCNSRDLTSTLCSSRVTRVQPDIANLMYMAAGTPVVKTEVVRYLGSKPIALSYKYIPIPTHANVDDVLEKSHTLRECGLIRHVVQAHSALPSPHERVQLKIPSNQPILITMAKNTDKDSTGFVVERIAWRGDCVSIEI